MSEQDVCGSTNTGDGEPCQNPPGCSIPAHNGMPDGGTERGRPPKFDDERARAAIDAREFGQCIKGCANAARVSRPTFYKWLDDEELEFVDEDGNHRSFVEAWREAEAAGERKLIREGLYDPDINDATARKLLATSFGHKETARHELEHSGEIDGERTLGDEEIAAIREALKR